MRFVSLMIAALAILFAAASVQMGGDRLESALKQVQVESIDSSAANASGMAARNCTIQIDVALLRLGSQHDVSCELGRVFDELQMLEHTQPFEHHRSYVLIDDFGNPYGNVSGRFPIPPSNGSLLMSSTFDRKSLHWPLLLRALELDRRFELSAFESYRLIDSEGISIDLSDDLEPTAWINTTDTGVTSQTFSEAPSVSAHVTHCKSANGIPYLEITQTIEIEDFGGRPMVGLPPSSIAHTITTKLPIDEHTIYVLNLPGDQTAFAILRARIVGMH